MNCSMRVLGERVAVLFLLLVICVPSGHAQQHSPRFGKWKLNVAKSTLSAGSAPQVLIRTDEPAGDGVKVTYEGIDADGSRIAYLYTAHYDGKEYRPSRRAPVSLARLIRNPLAGRDPRRRKGARMRLMLPVLVVLAAHDVVAQELPRVYLVYQKTNPSCRFWKPPNEHSATAPTGDCAMHVRTTVTPN